MWGERYKGDLRASNLDLAPRRVVLERYTEANWSVPVRRFLTRYSMSKNDPQCIDFIRAIFMDFRRGPGTL